MHIFFFSSIQIGVKQCFKSDNPSKQPNVPILFDNCFFFK